MILYLDASALVKRYVDEPGTAIVAEAIAQASLVGTSVISRAEAAAALAKAARLGVIEQNAARAALDAMRREWIRLVRIQATELLIARAETVAWNAALRGYDAVHLASALWWRESMRAPFALATFDKQLWYAAQALGIEMIPSDLPGLLAEWRPVH